MNDEPNITASITRRETVGVGAGLAALLAAAGLWPLSAESKRKKRKKKKKKKPPAVIARLESGIMTGANEVPAGSGDTGGTGSADFTIKSDNTICCDFRFATSTADSTVTGTHIHRGVAGVDGDIEVDFNTTNANLTACVAIDKALADEIIDNPAGFYANTHTNKFPNGAVRAQLALAPS